MVGRLATAGRTRRWCHGDAVGPRGRGRGRGDLTRRRNHPGVNQGRGSLGGTFGAPDVFGRVTAGAILVSGGGGDEAVYGRWRVNATPGHALCRGTFFAPFGASLLAWLSSLMAPGAPPAPG
eukprot:CAMPEP_0206831026 /NCGR_PEP_ID=MMETSP0975-20121206/17175_1 /ASSEMBLY_ACC=CAM_ASM_000399 /TAXON_ID=483370 /ORGANISM="non described non described, Strain CCMP2097" /LENGTH=121 /DNA_ID=CAMNT_0054373395 /DNA_START=280 /DNA_END=646 /DNA_ORIENTATION=-